MMEIKSKSEAQVATPAEREKIVGALARLIVEATRRETQEKSIFNKSPNNSDHSVKNLAEFSEIH